MQGSLSGLFKNRAGNGRSLGKFCEFLVEFVDTACRVYKFHFTGEERVAECRNLHFHERVFFTVLPGDGVFRIYAGFAYKSIIGRDVLEYNRAVAGRVDVFFHDFIFSKIRCKPVFSKFEAQKYKVGMGFTKHFSEKVFRLLQLWSGQEVNGAAAGLKVNVEYENRPPEPVFSPVNSIRIPLAGTMPGECAIPGESATVCRR